MEEIDSSVFDIFTSNGEPPPTPAGQAPAHETEVATGSPVHDVEDVEKVTKDFILKRLSEELRQNRFKEFVEGLLNAMGFKTKPSPEAADGVVDFLANKGGLDFQTLKVQVKTLSTSNLDQDVAALSGKLAKNDFGMVISLGRFTPLAQTYATSRKNFRLIDGNELVALIISHYDKLEDKYKAIIPLRKILFPDKQAG